MRGAVSAAALAPFSALAFLTLSACVAPSGDDRNRPPADATAATQSLPPIAQVPAPPPTPAVPPPPAGPANFVFAGELTQGGWIKGQVPGGTTSATLSDQPLALTGDGRFFAAFDRDAGTSAILRATLQNGRVVETPLAVSPRAWSIEHVNVARAPGGATEAFMARRRPELARIAASRTVNAQSNGWAQNFIWPATGRISGRFGSQRVYRGEPAAYHSGLDIARPTGTPFVAPADGVVVLAAEAPFSLEGYLLIIDHGMGLNSAFLHCSKILVREGDRVQQGQHIGDIGATGRATGPHLHWGIKWNDARLDPLLFLGPMG